MKIAVITCYKQPDYVRAQTLRAALKAGPSNEVIVIKNSTTGSMRYPEVLFKVIRARLRHRPDVYLLTFRGYEILPAINILTWPKKFIFDEFINPLEWLHEPRPEKWVKFVPKGLLRAAYGLLLHRPAYILADTPKHASYSESLTFRSQTNKPGGKYFALPVSTDESLFVPGPTPVANKAFRVFYYGNMLPLHGLEYVLEAAVSLRDLPIEFSIIGGKTALQETVRHAQEKGANISYKKWLEYDKLPGEIYRADLCLGGPFGTTTQAKLVITGKTYQFLACAAPTLIGLNTASKQFTNRKNCLMAHQGDAKDLADSIRWAFGHPKELKAIGTDGRKLYEELFSIKAIAPKLNALLHRPGV